VRNLGYMIRKEEEAKVLISMDDSQDSVDDVEPKAGAADVAPA